MIWKKNTRQRFQFIGAAGIFNSTYGTKYFKKYAENLKIGGPTLLFLKNLSLKYKDTYILGGLIPEEKDNKYYNTYTVWNNGTMIAVYLMLASRMPIILYLRNRTYYPMERNQCFLIHLGKYWFRYMF